MKSNNDRVVLANTFKQFCEQWRVEPNERIALIYLLAAIRLQKTLTSCRGKSLGRMV